MWIKSTSFNVWARYFVWNFKGTLWNSTQNILPIHWKIWFLYDIEILRAQTRFWNAPLVMFCCGLVPVNFAHILRGYFTATEAITGSNASEATLKNMGALIPWMYRISRYNLNKTRHNKSMTIFHEIYWGRVLWVAKIWFHRPNDCQLIVDVAVISNAAFETRSMSSSEITIE